MENVKFKPCYVLLENCTPKKQVGLSAEIHHEIQERNMLTTRTKQKVLKDLDEIRNVNESNDANLRNKIVSEVLSSEISYQKQLTIVKDYFMTPIKKHNILTTDEYDTLFCNIRTIANISNELLQELKKNMNIVDAFSKILPFFKLYSVYASHYKKSLEMLQHLSVRNAAFDKLLQMQETRPEVQSKLSALLITPIQRIPRYCLLLGQLLENTSSNHPSYFTLAELLKKVESVALHVNNLIEDHENAQLLLEFQQSLTHGFPSIIRPGRKLLKKGILTVIELPDNKKKTRCFILMTDILMYCKVKKHDINLPNSLKCSGIFPLNKCKIVENLDKGALTIICEGESLTVYHEHASEIQVWANVIHNRIRQYVSERRTLRKDSSARRPVIHKRNLGEYQEVGVSPGIPRKKRLISNQENETNDDQDNTSNTKNCFSWKPAKRKCIRNFNQRLATEETDTTKGKDQDSLYPLREFLALQNNDTTSNVVIAEEVEKINNAHASSKKTDQDVFVFGSNSQPRGFNFRMRTVFSDIGNSLKKLFGFGR